LQRAITENNNLKEKTKLAEDKLKTFEFNNNSLKSKIELTEKEYDNLNISKQSEEKNLKFTKPEINKKIANEEKKVYSLRSELE